MKPLTIHDYELINEYLIKADYEGYNSNFVTMMMWNHEYHIEYEIHENFLVMLHYYNNDYFWAMPFTTKEYYKEAIDYMIDYSKQNHFEFKIDCAIENFVNDIKDIYKDRFLYERTRYNDDYIYDKNMLMTLSGKKMQKRRNHYNAFLKNNPDYIYKDLDSLKDFNDVLECYSKWENNKEKSESLTSELYGIMYLLSCKDFLDIKAGAIYIHEKMEAFIIASKLNHKTIQIHVEKANKDIRGLYPAILKELLERHFEDYVYVNREEDMGLENLRKSKLALSPKKMIKKYCIHLNNTQIKKCTNEKEELKDIWMNTFEDETIESTEFYFTECFNKDNTYILKNNETTVSGLQIVPFQMKIKGVIETVYFILGVFTKKEYERQGCMKKLLDYVLSIEPYKDSKIYLQAYNPEIYKNFGFTPSHYHYKYNIDKEKYSSFEKDQLIDDFDNLTCLYQNYTSLFVEYWIRDDKYFEWLIKRTIAFKENIKVFKHENTIDGYVIYSNKDDCLYVSEVIYKNNQSLNRIIATLSDLNKKIIIETDLKTSIYGKKEVIVNMLSNYINDDYQSKYINEVY